MITLLMQLPAEPAPQEVTVLQPTLRKSAQQLPAATQAESQWHGWSSHQVPQTPLQVPAGATHEPELPSVAAWQLLTQVSTVCQLPQIKWGGSVRQVAAPPHWPLATRDCKVMPLH